MAAIGQQFNQTCRDAQFQIIEINRTWKCGEFPFRQLHRGCANQQRITRNGPLRQLAEESFRTGSRGLREHNGP